MPYNPSKEETLRKQLRALADSWEMPIKRRLRATTQQAYGPLTHAFLLNFSFTLESKAQGHELERHLASHTREWSEQAFNELGFSLYAVTINWWYHSEKELDVHWLKHARYKLVFRRPTG